MSNTKVPVNDIVVGATYEVSGKLLLLSAVHYNDEKGEFYVVLEWVRPSSGYSTISVGQFLALDPQQVDAETAA